MMFDNTTLGYIIGGSVAGGVLLIAVISIIAYCTCGSKRKKKRHDKKFHQLPPESGRQSQHSTLSQIDPRGLPKVGSGGLWVEAPAVYQAAPNQGLYYGRPNPKYRIEPGVQRSTSELRLPGPPQGHAVYQGARIYHSQQLAPVYEVIDTSRGPGVIGIYEYNDLTHSRSRLINRDSAERHHHRDRDGKKVKRSNSDLNHSRNYDKRENSKRHSSHGKQSSHSSNERHRSDHHYHQQESSSSRASYQKSQSLDSLRAVGSYDNPGFDGHVASVKVHSSSVTKVATDSMKLQDKHEKRPLYNKTDDEKQTPKAEHPDLQTKHYVYEGSLYAVPSKSGPAPKTSENEEYENPIVARMEAMILEKTGDATSDSRRKTPQPEGGVASASASQVRVGSLDPTYSQVDDVTSSVAVSVSSSTSHVTSGKHELKHPATGERLDTVAAHPPLSATHSEDLGPTGNQVTAEAFQFLDNYIGSDEEGVDSPPMSPGPHRDSGY